MINLYRSPRAYELEDYNPLDPAGDGEDCDYVTQRLQYDVLTMRWLNVERAYNGDEEQVIVYSGCLRPFYENGGKRNINVDQADEGNDVLELSYPVVGDLLSAEITKVSDVSLPF